MYNILKNVIERGQYDLLSITAKVNKLWAEDKITETERDELISKAQNNTGVVNADLVQAIKVLDERVKKLEADGKVNTESVEEYIPGKWYYNGDKVSENGVVYTCIAPAGHPCTHSPSEYKPFWRAE